MVQRERISHFPAAVLTSLTDTRVCCIGLLSAARPGKAARRHQSIHLHRTDFGRRKFTSDVRIPQFWMRISFVSAILHPQSCPCPQLHALPSRSLRHVTNRTVTWMTYFWFCLRCHFSILKFEFTQQASVEPYANSTCPANAISSATDGVEVWSTD